LKILTVDDQEKLRMGIRTFPSAAEMIARNEPQPARLQASSADGFTYLVKTEIPGITAFFAASEYTNSNEPNDRP
jgi:hypothetical protein